MDNSEKEKVIHSFAYPCSRIFGIRFCIFHQPYVFVLLNSILHLFIENGKKQINERSILILNKLLSVEDI